MEPLDYYCNLDNVCIPFNYSYPGKLDISYDCIKNETVYNTTVLLCYNDISIPITFCKKNFNSCFDYTSNWFSLNVCTDIVAN